jgi:hypothetical protein
MPPVPRGTLAVKLRVNKFLLQRRGGQLSQPRQKTSLKLTEYAVWRGNLADAPGNFRLRRRNYRP